MNWLIQSGLAFYKRWISPMLPNSCRFVPSCSEYAMEAVATHGVFRGTALSLWRLLRCNPLARGGYDPVPTAHHPCCHHTVLNTADAVITKR